MEVVAKIYVSYDGIDEDDVEKGLDAIIESGAESTCSSAAVINVYNAEDVVVISKKEYESLVKNTQKLFRLKAYGVDNWSGYSDAMSDSEGIFEED